MEFSRREYWSGLPFPPPADPPDPGTAPTSPVSPALAGGFFTAEAPGKPRAGICVALKKGRNRLCSDQNCDKESVRQRTDKNKLDVDEAAWRRVEENMYKVRLITRNSESY